MHTNFLIFLWFISTNVSHGSVISPLYCIFTHLSHAYANGICLGLSGQSIEHIVNTDLSCTGCSLRNVAVSLCCQTCCWKAMKEVASFLIINLGLMITLISNLGLLLLRRTTGSTRSRNNQRRRLGSGYWTRRKVYWRRREISRTGYIAEALQDSIKQRIYSQSEPQERKEMLTKPYSNILKMNSHAVSGG